MNQDRQSVRDIFVGALSRKRNDASPLEIHAFILEAARVNDYALVESGDLNKFEINFPTGETISFDGEELRLDKQP